MNKNVLQEESKIHEQQFSLGALTEKHRQRAKNINQTVKKQNQKYFESKKAQVESPQMNETSNNRRRNTENKDSDKTNIEEAINKANNFQQDTKNRAKQSSVKKPRISRTKGMSTLLSTQDSLRKEQRESVPRHEVQFKLEIARSESQTPINEKMSSLESKGNRLMDKVLAIQQQIQRFSQVEHKDLSSFALNIDTSGFGSFATEQNCHHTAEQKAHQQNLKRMNTIGRQKVKMIQNLENKIDNLQGKLWVKQENVNGEADEKKQDIEQARRQLEQSFNSYYLQKKNLLKQTKSEKFSFSKLNGAIERRNKRTRVVAELQEPSEDEAALRKNQGSDILDEKALKRQLLSTQAQFSAYRSRTNDQLEAYKAKLSDGLIREQGFIREIQRLKYQNLEQRIFQKQSNNSQTKKSSKTLPKPTEIEDFGWKTERINSYGSNFDDINQFKEEVSLKYMEENLVIKELNEKLRVKEEERSRIQMSLQQLTCHSKERMENLERTLSEKEKLYQFVAKLNSEKDQQIEELRKEIDEMNCYILECKEEMQQQSEALQEYKGVIEQFMQEVSSLRAQLQEKQNYAVELQAHLQDAQVINKECQEEIEILEAEVMFLLLLFQKTVSESFKSISEEEKERLSSIIKLKSRLNPQLSQKLEVFSWSLETLGQKYPQKQLQLQSLGDIECLKDFLSFCSKSPKLQSFISEIKLQQKSCSETESNKKLQKYSKELEQMKAKLQSINRTNNSKKQQEVTEGIKSYFKCRRNLNQLQHKTVVHSISGNSTSEQQNQLFDLKIGHKEINHKTKVLTARTQSSQIDSSLSKLLDIRFNLKFNSVREQDFTFKAKVCLKLIHSAINFFTESTAGSNQGQVSSKSMKSSYSKLSSFSPENIFVKDLSEITVETRGDKLLNSALGLQDKIERLERNYENYSFVYVKKNRSEEKVSKNEKSLLYLSPQVLLSMNESESSYCWSLGIMIDQIFNHKTFYNRIEDIICRKNNYTYPNQSNERHKKLKELLEKMLKKNYKERPRIDHVYQTFKQLTA